MTEEVKAEIVKWIFDNHEHHEFSYDGMDDDIQLCSDRPYVDSLDLEKFIKEL